MREDLLKEQLWSYARSAAEVAAQPGAAAIHRRARRHYQRVAALTVAGVLAAVGLGLGLGRDHTTPTVDQPSPPVTSPAPPMRSTPPDDQPADHQPHRVDQHHPGGGGVGQDASHLRGQPRQPVGGGLEHDR